MEDNNPEVTLDSVLQADPAQLNEDQTKFLNDNADNLTDEQRETYKDILKPATPENVNPDEIQIATRRPVTAPPSKPTEDEEVDPDDEKTIGKVLDRRLQSVNEQLREANDKIEVDSYLRERPEYSKYRNVILKYMKNDAYSNIPVENIAAMVSVKDQQSIGAAKEREAALKASRTRSPGTTIRKPEGGAVDWFKATPEEIEEQKNKIYGRG
jgi:hypothetical protein